MGRVQLRVLWWRAVEGLAWSELEAGARWSAGAAGHYQIAAHRLKPGLLSPGRTLYQQMR